MNKKFKTFSLLSLILTGLTVIFTVLLISFKVGISFLSFFISLIYIACPIYILFFEIIKNKNGKHRESCKRLVEILPFVLLVSFIIRRSTANATSYAYDLITVLLWFGIYVLSLIISRKLDYKRFITLTDKWSIEPIENKYKGVHYFIYEALDWLYVIVWSVFTILLVQMFLFQMYQIPSESMVPTFLIKDRAVVSKIDCGPKFPLTDVGLPTFRKFKKGDTVVFRNPHYKLDRKRETKYVTSQIVQMLTFSTVILDKDEYGNQIPDPLVKRIVATEGEQLVMQDGVLYVRTKDNLEFTPSASDAKYACWDLTQYQDKYKNKIHNYLYNSDTHEAVKMLEEERRNYNLEEAKNRALYLVKQVNSIPLPMIPSPFNVAKMDQYYLVNNSADIAYGIYTSMENREWFTSFMTSWINQIDEEKDIYSEASYKLNVMTKINFGEIVYRFVQMYYNNEEYSNVQNDEAFRSHLMKENIIYVYLNNFQDFRNMPVFPSNDVNGNPQYIPEKHFFMMGDNRLNSLDLRHDLTLTEKPLTNYDLLSITYKSRMNPQYISEDYLIGKPIFTFWPLSRIGKV